MSANGVSPVAGSSTWNTTRPWAPHLSLIAREISSVSATFILSFSIPEVNSDVASLIQAAEQNDENKNSGTCFSLISEIFAKRLFSVNVNGAHWQRICVRVAESGDEAVIIIYGLLPGRQYEIDLGLVQDGQNSCLHSHFTTDDRDHQDALDAHIESELTALDSTPASPSTDCSRRRPSHSSSASTSSSSAFTPDSGSSHTSHNGVARSASPSTNSDTSSADVPPDSTEERVIQLQETLNALNAEEETLNANLKSLRREAQKADAALRAEMEVLKRASEKHAVAEQRAKQKILALQEAHKRAIAVTQETKEHLSEIEASLPDLMKEKEEKEKECEKIEAEAVKTRKERERIEEAERKQIESMNTELAALKHKLEKLRGKREKLETSTIPDLERQLQDIMEEITKMETEEGDLEVSLAMPSSSVLAAAVDEMGVLQLSTRSAPNSFSQPLQQQRSRNNSFHSGPSSNSMIGGQQIPSGQRSLNHQSQGTPPHLHHQSQQSWSVTPPRQTQAQRHSPRTFTYPQPTSSPNARSQHQQPPTILSNPHRKAAQAKAPTSSSTHSFSPIAFSPSMSSSSNNTSPPMPLASEPPSKASSSTLSSHAPAFEPGLGLGIFSKGASLHQRSGFSSSVSTGVSNGSGHRNGLRSSLSSLPGRPLWNPAQEQEAGSR